VLVMQHDMQPATRFGSLSLAHLLPPSMLLLYEPARCGKHRRGLELAGCGQLRRSLGDLLLLLLLVVVPSCRRLPGSSAGPSAEAAQC
jgi:hypothetical protein